MSANKEAIKLSGRTKSVDPMRKKQLPTIIGPVTSETRGRPRFDSHTQSSLMKRKELMRPKLSSTSTSSLKKCTKDAQKKESTGFGGLSGVCKKRSSITKQSKSMQVVKMIFQREKDRRACDARDNDLTKTVRQPKQLVDLFSSILFRDDLIINVSRSLKKCAESQTKNVSHDERTTIVDQFEKHAENLCTSSQDEIKLEENSSTFVQSSSESTWDCFENHSVENTTPRIQSNEEEAARTDSNCEIQVFHRESSSAEPTTEKSEEDLLYVMGRTEMETRMYRRSRSTNANVATDRKSTRKTWMIKKANTQREHVDGDHAYRADPRGAANSTFRRKADNSRNENAKLVDDQVTRTKSTLQKHFVPAYQRVWRPPGINRAPSTVKTTQSTSQKSSRSAGKFISTRSKQTTSNDCIEYDNESTMKLMSANQSRMLKENRDPCADCISKICNHFMETKQRQKLQSGAPKRRRSANKMVSQASSNSNDVEPSSSKSRSNPRRYWQKRFVVPAPKDRNDTDQSRTEATLTCNKRAKPSEVIHTLKEIINCVNGDEDVEENAVSVSNDDVSFHHENRNSETLNDSCSKITPNDERLDVIIAESAATRACNLECCCKSIIAQMESNFPSSPEPNDGERFDENSQKTVESSRTVATQVSLCYEKSVIEIGCNTTSCDIRKDAEVSCALIGSANLGTNGDPTMTEDKLTPENIEDKSSDENKNLRNEEEANDNGGVFDMEISPKARARVGVEVPVEKNFIKRTKEELVHKEDTDKQQEFKGYIEKYDANDSSVDNSFAKQGGPSLHRIYDFDASCSEEIAENMENYAKSEEETATPRSTMLHIPNDVIAAFELAAERARNLYKAIMIHQENVMSRERGKRKEETTENYKTLYRPTVDEDCTKKCALFKSEAEDKMKSEYETKCHLVMVNNDFDGSSTCSCSDQSCCSDQMYKLGSCMSDLTYRADRSQIESLRKDNVIFSQSDTAITKSILNESSDVANVKSLMLRVQEHELTMVKFNDNGDGENFKLEESASILALPMIEKPSFISCENLFPFICCVLCTVIFWCLQFSFRCDPSA